MSLIETAATAVSGFFGGIQTYLIVGAVVAVAAGGAGAYAGYRWELGTYEKLEASDIANLSKAKDVALAKTKVIDASNEAKAVADATAQQKIVTVTQVVTKEIPAHVTPQQDTANATSHYCISYGLVRVLVAAERGADPASLSLPAGTTDDACAPYEPSKLAADLAADFGAANGNAQQLNDLIASVKANDAANAAAQ